MEDIHSIIVNVLSNVIWLPVGVLLAYLGFWIQVRFPNRKLWLLKDPSHLVVCVANSTTTNTGVYQRPATGVGQLRALILATRSLPLRWIVAGLIPLRWIVALQFFILFLITFASCAGYGRGAMERSGISPATPATPAPSIVPGLYPSLP